jgi:hypothetical protein
MNHDNECEVMNKFALKIAKDFARNNGCWAKRREHDLVFGGADIFHNDVVVSSVIYVPLENLIEVVAIPDMQYIKHNAGNPEVAEDVVHDLTVIKENKWKANGAEQKFKGEPIFEWVVPLKPDKSQIMTDILEHHKRVYKTIFRNTFKD